MVALRQIPFSAGVSSLGNTDGQTGITGTRVVLAGAGNITLSQLTDASGGTITISGSGGGGGGDFSAGVSNLGNTLGQTGVTGSRLALAGIGAVTLSQLTDGNGGTVSISVPSFAQSVQTQNRFNLTLDGNTAGAMQEVSSGTLTLAGGNNITLSQNGNAITISGPNVLGAQTGISGIVASDATYTSGTVTFTGAGNITVASGTGQRIIISGSQSVQPETQTFVGGISASNTLYTSGTVRFTGVGGGVTVSSNTGQRVDISVAAPVAQTGTQFSAGLSNLGNTGGDTGTVGGRLVLVGSNNITLSGSTNGVSETISIFGQSGGGAGFSAGVSGGNTSGDTGATGTRVVFAGGNNITLSQSTNANGGSITVSAPQTSVLSAVAPLSTSTNGQTISILGPAQLSVGNSNLGNTQGDTGVVTGRLVLVGTNNITLSGSTDAGSMTISFSGASGGGAGFSAGVSNVGNTVGDTGITGSRLVLAGGNGITLSQSTNASGGTVTISGITQSVESQSFGMSNIGNTSGTTGIASGGQIRFLLAGGNNITLSQSLNGASGTITISAFTQSAESQSHGMSNLGNTSGTTGIASGAQVRFLFAGGNNITLSQSLNGASGTITISGPNTAAQSNQTLGMYAVQNTTAQSSSTTMDARTISVAGDGAVSVGYSAGSLRISAPTQTGTQFSGGLSNIGNTAGDTGTVAGRLVLAGGNNITLSGSTNGVSETITISAGAGGGFSAGASNLGNTAGNTGVTGTRLVLVGTNNISLSQTTDANGATLSINNTVSAFQAGASNLGNTAGDTGVTGTRLVLVGTNNISLSQTTGANGATLSISGNPAFSGGVSNVGNTGGATGVSGTRLVLVGSNNVTLSQTTDANGATVSMFGQAPAGGAFSGGASNLGNTAGNTGITGTQLVLVGTNAISLSQTTGANGGTLSIDAPATSSLVGTSGISISTNGSTISVMQTSGSAFLSSYAPYDDSPMVTGQQGQGTLHVQPMRPPGDLVMDRIALGVQISNATNSSNSITISQYIGVYTRNASSISLVSSISSSTNFTGSGTVGSYSLYGGPKWHTIPWTMTLTGGVDYFVGIIIRTTTGGGAGHSISQLLLSKFTNSNWSGILGAGSNATNQRLLGNGVYTATTAGLPANIPFASLNGEGSVVLRNPVYMLRSGTV